MAGGGGSEEEEGLQLYRTPTWIVAVVCTVIVCISLFFERFLHRLGKRFNRRNQKPLSQALEKMKEELMLMGFISLLLVVFQGTIQKICIAESFTRHLRPCKGEDTSAEGSGEEPGGTAHYIVGGSRRRLFATGGSGGEHCAKEGKVPLLSIEAIHELHIFIFALAATHITLSVITMVLGGAKIRQWKRWEESIHKEAFGKWQGLKNPKLAGPLQGNPKFDFHKYMVRALEADFKKVVGLSWYLWIFVVVFLFLNVGGWHAYFWLSLVPLMLLFAVGSKLEHIIVQLAHEVAEKHSAIEGDLVVRPSDDHFWFHRPRIMLLFIHLILFHVAFEFAYFFWILATYGYNSCIMDATKYIIPRLIICLVVQVICSYSTLPLYAIVTQMGSSFKPVIFEDHVQAGLVGWAQTVKKKGKKLTTALSRRPKEEPQLECVFSIKNREMEQFGPEIVELNDSNINHGA
ncbi:hypothetical protein HPP92_009127 [Vanilla planifolia]|uniref:MLO-like protein n=1 Tax=Vanilla planifolia TaxID=51239 RepID=A0A835RJA7_VANPL|nr:hypothetical protein HPP92_009127 [Vanilla planifolia]